jgi:hypothetical protein
MGTAVRTRWWRGFPFWSALATVLVSAALGVATNVATNTPRWGWIVGGGVLVLALLGLALANLARTARAQTAHLLAERAEVMDPSWPTPDLDAAAAQPANGSGSSGGTGDPGGVLFWLDARFCPSPLWGRSAPRRELEQWCASAASTDVVRIVSGPGGVGKSRLMVELARHYLPEGWFAGRPDPTRLGEVVARVLACEQPVLLVIEDAERVSGLARFLQRATAEPDRIRVVLTSRNGEALRTRLREDPDTALGPVLQAPVIVLPAVGHAGDRQQRYVEAIHHYARVLRMPRPDVPGAAPVGRDGDIMLLLQARALLAVLNRPGARTLGLGEVAQELVGAEQQRWARDPTLPAGWGIQLPPRLGALLRDLASRPPTPLMIPHGPNTPRWLFPGRIPGQPIDGHSLTNLLNRHGINARPARNAALASDLPAAILADLLGLHVNTAVRWVTYARRDWADYLALRAADQKESTKREGNSAQSE